MSEAEREATIAALEACADRLRHATEALAEPLVVFDGRLAAILADFETRIARREAEVLMRDEWAYPDTR